MAENKLSLNTNRLLLSIGNTSIHLGFAQSSYLNGYETFPTKRLPYRHFPQNKEIWVASVVPKVSEKLRSLFPQFRFLNNAEIPLKNLPDFIGTDRALALYAATQLYSKDVIVIDAGTAMTLTIALDGVFIGGLIMPGLTTMAGSLAKTTAQLPLVCHFEPSQEISYSSLPIKTEEAIAKGCLELSTKGLSGILSTLKKNKEYQKAVVVLTGGNALKLAPLLPEVQVVNPSLILEGMALLTS